MSKANTETLTPCFSKGLIWIIIEFVMMMRGFGISALLLISFCVVSCYADKVSVACMMAYDEGGALGVLQSSECPHWVPSAENPQDNRQNCQFAMLQGRREYQEDRVTCNLDMKIPYSGKDGPEEANIGIAAVFDGHGGKEASDLASKLFLDYFRLNVQFNSYKNGFPLNQENEEADRSPSALERSLPEIDDKSLHDILEEALMRTFQDIDSEFSMEALNKGYVGGSTGTVVLLLNGQLLIGYVGDSKALLCRERDQSHHGTEELYAEELTRDHHPDRDDEKARIEAAGGTVRVWGVPRVNGILAVSRAIGDVYLKRYGVIAVPEVIGWRNLTGEEDSYVVIASDGIFESLTPQQVCDIMQSTYIQGKQASKNLFSCLSSSSLADCIVNTAFREGSTDNLSAIVISLRPASSSQQDSEAINRAEL